jgi:uncharacterized protein YdaL
VVPPPATTKTLVLYDTEGQWGYLGELYAEATANLAGHFGTVDAKPIANYTSGLLNAYTAVVYIGSTYYGTDRVPVAFYNDVASGSRPVIWANDNIWNFANAIGPAAFENKYGWDPTNSYFAPSGTVGSVTTVTYMGAARPRTVPASDDSGILHPYILGGAYPAVTTLALALDTSTNTTFPWAIRSGNLTYIGEVPYDYTSESDRIIAFEDLLFDALAPNTATRHRAMVRLEDINPSEDPAEITAAGKVLSDLGVPFAFDVIPLYKDPKGTYHNGVETTIAMTPNSAFVTAINYLLSHGGTMVDHGYTHQYSNVFNPYNGVTGEDAEFFLAHVDAATNNVVWDGPIPGDATDWAQGLMNSAFAAFAAAGLPAPTLWETPHYFGTDRDYKAAANKFAARYERSLYFQGVLASGTATASGYTNYLGQFFPYVVKDVYGTWVLPENLGNYEPLPYNNHPARLPADIIKTAQLNLAVRDGFASFFYHPSYGPTYGTGILTEIVNGIKALGYTFVAPSATLR